MPKKIRFNLGVVSEYFSYFTGSLGGGGKKVSSTRAYMAPALIILLVFILFNAFDFDQTFYSLTNLNTFTGALQKKTESEVDEGFKDAYQASQELYEKMQEERQAKAQKGEFLGGMISDSLGILAFILYLWLMARFVGHGRAGWADATVTVSYCTIPISIGMFISHFLIKAYNRPDQESPATMYFVLAVLVLLIALVTALILLYVNTSALMKISGTKRYFATVIGVLIAMAITGAVLYYGQDINKFITDTFYSSQEAK